MARASAVLALLLAVGCGSATSQSETAPAPGDDTSEDELNTKARFTHLRRGPTDADLASLDAAAAKFEGGYLGVYRFNKAGPEATDPDARMKRVKEVMHRYMCSFFDEAIDLGRPSGANAVKTTMNDVDLDRNADGAADADVTRFANALGAVFANKKLDVMSGSASGNNTAGEIMGVYDVAHNEVLFFGFTNCGSDN